ncbi:hypothetical protein MEX01_49030 [Methylorubrum extorquens]|nr:hypothetical protein MEX01_49030 [Methylorubrum extorquens]
MKAVREAWYEGQRDLDPDRLVFLDENAANTAMARRYGRARRGERCRMSVPQGHWKTTTIPTALRTRGITAPWLLDGAMKGRAFRTYMAARTFPSSALLFSLLMTEGSAAQGMALAEPRKSEPSRIVEETSTIRPWMLTGRGALGGTGGRLPSQATGPKRERAVHDICIGCGAR